MLPPKDSKGKGLCRVEKLRLPISLYSKVHYKVLIMILASGCYCNIQN